MSVNERLFTSGLLDRFDAAAQNGERKRMIALLIRAGLSENNAARWADTLLEGPKSLRSWYK